MDKRIIPLAIGGLGIGTTEFTIMGLLPDIANSLQVTVPEAGHFIAAYALGVVVGAPLLIGATVKLPPKKVLIGLMLAFTLFNALSAVASNYYIMLATRFLSGLPHGAFFGVGTVVAARLAGPGKEARYISLMFTGLTVANLVMVPLVTYVGHTFHWLWYFVIVSVIGVLAMVFLKLWLPVMDGNHETDYKRELQFLKTAEAWYVLLIVSIGFGGLFAWLSYISPLMTDVAHFDPASVAYIMILAGGGMVVGNIVGGVVADKMGAAATTTLLLVLMMAALAGTFFFSSNQTMALVLTFLCGGLSLAAVSPVNMMIMKATPGAEMMGAAFIQAAFNVANSAGAYFGGIPLVFGLSYNYPSLVGVGLALIGLIICFGYMLKYGAKEDQEMIPAPVSVLTAEEEN